MSFREIFSQLNIFAQCKKYRLPLWQCPQFLFLIMGVIIIGSSVATYLIGTRYIETPLTVVLIVLAVSIVLFIIAFVITHSFERLAEAVRMKSEFVSIVSHQLRSPLSNLSWAIDLLRSGRLGKIEKKQTEYFRILEENTGRMKELVSDLLTVSRIEQRTLPLQEKEFSLEDLTQDLISEFEPFARASNAKLSFESQPELPEVWADPDRIKLVIENLLDNAIRYIEKKGKIEIGIRRKDNQVLFKIKDNGVGIPESDQKYIFKKFFRSESGIRRQTQGSGLGLFIAKSIIEKSGGEIWFESQLGQGTTFYFTLPTK